MIETAERISELAESALRREVLTTPKPGLVDRNNTGSHRDMDVNSFLRSAAALKPFFAEMYAYAFLHADQSETAVFYALREIGVRAEKAMFRATGGINTHKGAVFSMGILCGALGYLRVGTMNPTTMEGLMETCARLGRAAMDDFSYENEDTFGRLCYKKSGITGIRGQVASGFPQIMQHAWPELNARLAKGCTLNQAAVFSLIRLIANVADTNMIRRGGLDEARRRMEQAGTLAAFVTDPQSFLERVEKLDDEYIGKNLSPGGCADLLAITLLLYFLQQNGYLK